MDSEIIAFSKEYVEQLRCRQELISNAIRRRREEGKLVGMVEYVRLDDASFNLRDGEVVTTDFVEYSCENVNCWGLAVSITPNEIFGPVYLSTYLDCGENKEVTFYTRLIQFTNDGYIYKDIYTDQSGNVIDGADNWLLEFQEFAIQVVTNSY